MKKGTNPKEKEGSSFESVNPMYRGSSLKLLQSQELVQPSWFSSRNGSHLDRASGVLYDCPVYGLQVADSLNCAWNTGSHLIGAILYKPQDQVYQARIQVPPWLLFASGPEFEGEVTGNPREGYKISLSTADLLKSVSHFKKSMRDPSLDILSGVLKGSEGAQMDLISSKPQKESEWPVPMFSKARVRFNPWFRKQLDTIDFS